MVAVITACFVLGLVAGYVFGRNRWWRRSGYWLGFLVAVFAFCLVVPKNGQGFEDIGYAIVAVLICLPAALGTLGGLLVGWLRARANDRAAG